MTKSTLQNPAAAPAKKVWSDPQLVLIDQNEVLGGALPNGKEIFFTPIPGNPGHFHYGGGAGTYTQGQFDNYVVS